MADVKNGVFELAESARDNLCSGNLRDFCEDVKVLIFLVCWLTFCLALAAALVALVVALVAGPIVASVFGVLWALEYYGVIGG